MLNNIVENASFSVKFFCCSLASICPTTSAGEKTTTIYKYETQSNLLSEYILHEETIVIMGWGKQKT